VTTDFRDRVDAARVVLNSRRSSLGQEVARRDLLQEQLGQRESEVLVLNSEAEVFTQVRTLFQTLEDSKRELVRSKIEALVTYGIQSVFGPHYAFRIEQKTARNQVTFEYRIKHEFEGSVHESALRGAHGGGLVALVGFLLRVVMVLFAHPARRRIIFLDETMAALDGDKRGAFAALVRRLGDSLGLQVVLITHSPEYADEADKVYLVRPIRDGVSTLSLQS
jgi:DNA repair exonuclease SbcCD ATPase subunit